MPQEGLVKLATLLSEYYGNLISKEIPDRLATEIVLDAAKRLHGSNLWVPR